MTNDKPRHFLARIDARFRRANPGSVLIIVIVLLLLLAILGAAYISTTRSARVASAQSVLNSDVDTMLSGISKICEGTIVDDLNDTFGNLHGNTAYSGNTSIVNRSFYQGRAGISTSLALAPNTPAVAGTPLGYSYNPGDLVNDVSNPFVFYDLAGSAAVTVTNDITPLATPGSGWQVATCHLPITALFSNSWLADRIPDPAGTGTPLWTALTQSVQVSASYPNGASVSILGTDFQDPTYAWPGTNPRNSGAATGTDITSLLNRPLVGGTTTSASPLYPTSIALANGLNIPALTYDGSAKNTFAAGDADGDGIADSLLFLIPGASLDGLTWYAAVRIVDDNSAINANTAWSRDSLTMAGAPDNWNLFQTSVGLQELINAGDSINNINKYRFQAATAGLAALDETAINGNAPPATYDRTNTSKDYGFISQQEAYYQQFIRRMSNPGYNTAGVPYQPFPLADEASLAYHFCLTYPNVSTPSTVLETALPDSLFWKVAPVGATPGTAYNSTPYDPSAAVQWYKDNFAYSTSADNLTLPGRAVLVTRNPVSNYIQQVYDNSTTANNSETILPNYMLPYGPNTTAGATNPHFRGIWTPSPNPAYAVNDIVVFPGSNPPGSVVPTYVPTTPYGGPSYTFICVSPPTSGQVPATFSSNNVLTGVTTAYWRMQPWSSNPVKANVNTAAFPELFRAFWSVMAGNPSNATPFGTTGVDNYNIYDATAPTPSNPTLGNPQAMFRSPIRDPFGAAGTAYVSLLDAPNASGNVTNTNTMLLRAALAAVNTLGLRDNSQNVLSRTITLLKNSQINNGGSPPAPVTGTVELQVFSSAPQPVICEVYANTFTGPDSGTNTSNPQGYVAVELYNPYSVPMTLKNWQLGLINRSTSGGAYPYLYFQTNPPPATGTPPPVPPAGAVSVIGPMVALNNPIVDPKNGLYDNPVAPGTIYIPAHGYALLENYNGSGTGTTTANDATCRPVNALNPQPPTVPTTGGSFRMSAAPYTADQTGIWYGPAVPAGQTPTSATPPNTCDVYVPNLQLVIAGTKGTTITGTSTGGELVLLRPRRIDGTYSQSTGPDSVYNEGTTDASGNVTTVYLWDLVPVDSYDFTGLAQPAAVPYPVWSYVRVKGTLASNYFKQFFPGFYDAAKPMRQSYGTGAGAVYITAATVAGETPPWAAGDTPSFGVDASTASYNNPFPPVQIYNLATGNAAGDPMHFPNSVVSSLNAYPNGITPAATNLFPLGGFARNGDMLDIPFVGAYRIRISNAGALTSQVNTSNFLELNSLPMDCSLAAIETGINAEDAAQNIGRFIPMAASYQYVTGIQTGKFPDGTAATAPLSDYYAWARNFFNYLTVQSSTDTYLPNFDPNVASVNYAASPNNTFAYPPQNAATPIPPTPTLTASATAPDQTHQDNVGIEGLININTASWKVLSMLPFVPNNPAVDRLIAQNIVKYRLANGPFTSIFDLNQVTGFQNGTGVAGIPTAPTSSTGLLSPPDPNFGTSTAASTTPTGITEDYQWDCLTLSRISNLITTRSDTFTVYIEVQGWQNAGSTNASLPPQPMITRRYAFIVDRSAINGDPNSRFLKTVTVPND